MLAECNYILKEMLNYENVKNITLCRKFETIGEVILIVQAI